MRTPLFVSGLLLALLPARMAAQLVVSSYSVVTGGSANYPDNTGTKLTDGTTYSLAWGGGGSIELADVAALWGTLNSDPVVDFNFATGVTIRAVTVYFADSNGASGVGMPASATLSTPGGFSQSFSVTDPTGAGTTVPVTFTGFETTTSTMRLSVGRAYEWTMLSEVTFSSETGGGAIPEPGTSAACAGGAALLAACTWRRRKA